MRTIIPLIIASVILYTFVGAAKAEEIAKLYSKEGVVSVRRAGSANWSEITAEDKLFAMDTVKTDNDSRAGLLFNSGVLVRLSANARLQLKEQGTGVDQPLTLDSGAAHFFSRSPKQFPKVETPIMTASVRGTEFVVEASQKDSRISVLDGSVLCENKQGSVELRGGEEAQAIVGSAPIKKILIRPLDAVQWALHYPPILEIKTPEQISKAEKAITIADSANRPKLLSALLAQKSLLALMKNDKKEADVLSRDAISADSNSVIALLARSYVEQSNFRLKESAEFTAKAAKLSPASSFIKARQAELALAFGEGDTAVKLAQEAHNISPNDTYALTVLGFAALSRLDTDNATAYFDKAIQADSALGLPHLGLGLARIRQGLLDQGRENLQIAAHLEPNVALYRSYLGKAFFEEDRESDADHEYARAIELDPLDPTPHLYRAFSHLSAHRPVEALTDIEESIELNDNRAVYRSQLLLDQDSAVRSAGLSQAFKAVGFSAASKNEALKSLNKDYANYSAHLLLADSYDDSDLYATATLSELLLARLLAPVSFNLVRPTSSSAVSSNEFNALFDRPISRTQIEGGAETKKRLGNGRIIQSGSDGKFAYALDYEARYADGYRDNDRENSHNLYLSGQHQLTPNDTLLLDGNFTTFDDGDTELGFDPAVNDPDSSTELDDYFVRLGINHEVGPRSKLIGQFLYNNSSLKVSDSTFDRLVVPNIIDNGDIVESLDALVVTDQSIKFDSHGVRADGQYIADTDLVSVVVGGGVLNSSQDQNEDGVVVQDDTALVNNFALSSLANNDEKSERGFVYTTWHMGESADLNLGANYSHLTLSGSPLNVPFIDDTDEMSKWSPKAGISIYCSPEFTLRGAYFETIGTSGLRELEIIEPTFVGGFNQQFFDIFPGTESNNYAAGFDYKIFKGTYLGAESVWRDIYHDFSAPFTSIDVSTSGELIGQDIIQVPVESDAHEQIVRTYLYRVLTKKSTTTLDYIYSDFDDGLSDTNAKTNRIKAGLNYFLQSGWFMFGSATWRDQNLNGYDGAEAEDGTRDFWIVDTGVGYQFGKRKGQVVAKLNNVFDQEFKYIPTGLESEILPGIGGTLLFSVNF